MDGWGCEEGRCEEGTDKEGDQKSTRTKTCIEVMFTERSDVYGEVGWTGRVGR